MSTKQEDAPHEMSEELTEFVNLFCKITNKALGDIKGDEIHKIRPHENYGNLKGDITNRNK